MTMIKNTQMLRIILGLLALVLTTPRPALAWNDTGHRLIAEVAWADMTPAARSRFSDILRQHPRYQQDLLADVPDGMAGADQDRYAFGLAAAWPDAVRSQANPMHAAFNHPGWHFIDIPYCLGGQAAIFPADTNPGPKNLLEALALNTATVKDATAAGRDRAVALCWVLHLCGDVHQPLHVAELFSPRFPKGDQGGNAIIVLRNPPYPDSQVNLHALWDQLPGLYKDEGAIRDLALGLRGDPRYGRGALKDLLAVTDPAAWAKESHDLAVKVAYENGELPGIVDAVAAGDAAQPPGLTAAYLKLAEETAMERVVLAGYRTADWLNGM
jgi:hypothetical protein